MSQHKSHINFIITLLAIGWGLLVAVTALRAQWSGPNAQPPGGNPSSFLTSGTSSETKTGPLTINNNFYVTGNTSLGSTATPTSARVVITPVSNAAIDAGNGFIRTEFVPVDDYDVVTKTYLISSLSGSNYWTLSTSTNSIYPTSTDWKVAIGTTTAGTGKLVVMGGNVGIGTINPGAALEIKDTNSIFLEPVNRAIRSSATDIILRANNQNIFRGLDSWTGTWSDSAVTTYFQTGRNGGNTAFSTLNGSPYNRVAFLTNKFQVTNLSGAITPPVNYFQIDYNSNNLLSVQSSGNVGIGTTGPSALLAVNGNVIGSTPTANEHLATKAYVDASAQSLWVNSGSYLYPTSTSWRVGIGTTSPSSALHIYPRTDTEGVRIVSSNYSPLVIRNSSDTADLFRVNQSGDVTAVTSSATKMRSNNYCDATGANCFNPSSGWSTGISTIFLTTTTTAGSFSWGGAVGYDAGNKICANEQSGSHFCRTDEIIYLIQKNGTSSFSAINGQDAWIADGPPGYTGSTAADDCAGWTNNTTNNLGHFWIFSTAGGGRGALIHCGTVKKIACCK